MQNGTKAVQQKRLTVRDLRHRGRYSFEGIVFEALYNEWFGTWDLYEVDERGALRIYSDGVMVALVLRHGEYETGDRVGSVGDLEEVEFGGDGDDTYTGATTEAPVSLLKEALEVCLWHQEAAGELLARGGGPPEVYRRTLDTSAKVRKALHTILRKEDEPIPF